MLRPVNTLTPSSFETDLVLDLDQGPVAGLASSFFHLGADFEAVFEADHLEVAAHHCEFDFGRQF